MGPLKPLFLGNFLEIFCYLLPSIFSVVFLLDYLIFTCESFKGLLIFLSVFHPATYCYILTFISQPFYLDFFLIAKIMFLISKSGFFSLNVSYDNMLLFNR